MRPSSEQQSQPSSPIRRIRFGYAVLLLLFSIFAMRAFYLQVIKYDYYRNAALSDQLKQYQIPAARGIIEAHDGESVVPIVLNQKLYTVYVDPTLIKDADKVAKSTASILGGSESKYKQQITTPHTRYVVLAKKVSQGKEAKLLTFKYPGLGAQQQDYRTYPQGELASQLLGFVNDAGSGEYGIEQALNGELAGKPGELKAITDASGVPLAATSGNIEVQPKTGDNLELTIDLGMQKQMEDILKQATTSEHAVSASAVIMNVNTGAIKAMANYPTYDPSNYSSVKNASVYQNGVVSNPIEVGSVMKTLTTSAALNQGVIQPNTTFYDPAHWLVDGFNITDIEEDGGPGEQSIASLLNLSLNTGATWELMQMGGGQLDQKGRDVWHDYMVNHFQLGKLTGVEQGYESPGYVPSPKNNGAGINLTYANTAFGQAMTATPLQMAAALSSVLNGGTYYQPHLIDKTTDTNTGKVTDQTPTVVKRNVVAPKVGQELIPLMEYVVQQHLLAGFPDLKFSSDYMVGGKTGTAQVTKPNGGYYDNIFNGTYVGFVGGDKVQDVIVVFVNRPVVAGYAGTYAAQPIFASLAHMLINGAYVTPKS